MRHLVIGQRQKAPNFSAFHWLPYGCLITIGQHFVTTRVVHLPKRTKTRLITESDQSRANHQLLQLCTVRTAWSESDQAVRAVHSCKLLGFLICFHIIVIRGSAVLNSLIYVLPFSFKVCGYTFVLTPFLQSKVSLHCKNIRRFYGKITGNQLSVHFPLFLQASVKHLQESDTVR